MRIAVTAKGATLDSPMEPKFGRCAHVLLVDPETMDLDVMENPYAEESGGSGSRLVSLIRGRGADVVLTGRPGPNAWAALEAAGIRTVTGCSGTVRQALDGFRAGEPEEGGRQGRT